MRHQEFLRGVATRAGFKHAEDAALGATVALAALAEQLPADDRDALATALPSLVEPGSGPGSAAVHPGAVAEGIVRRTGWSPDRARHALAAVVDQLTAEDPELGRRVALVLPDDVEGDRGPVPRTDVAADVVPGG